MKLAQTFQAAVKDPANWYKQDGVATLNWNFVDADCYCECRFHYASTDAFYAEFNALCDIYSATLAFDRMEMANILVDTVPA